MGTTLTNGIYLPNEGEKNCYAGLKTNWEILDQKVADVTALQQAVAGALHREIVESLPTTDIDPNTIYMVLSGTSATENVYNEFMYVNNAWELIGTSATDLTNYYTKGDVDGLLLLKANASDLTSHTGNTTIHVTASDKSKWNTVALIKQLRLVNTQVGSATTIAFANIDDTNGIKVGDKCMDLDAKMFEITAVDTANQTVTVGSALIDLALDANVVHTSGDETISGYKVFENICLSNSIKAINLENQTIDLNNCYSLFGLPQSGNISFYFCNTNDGTANISNLPEQRAFFLISQSIRILSAGSVVYLKQTLVNSNGKTFVRYCNNSVWGSWQDVTNLVTTDTNQTILGNKTFSSNVNVYNSDATATTPNLYLRSSKIEISSQGNTSGDQNLTYLDKNNTTYAYVKGAIQSNGSAVKIRTVAKDSSDNSVVNELQMLAHTNGNKAIFPTYSNEVDLGISNYKWKSFNGVEPSSLSLPSDRSARIDISGYFTNTGTGNTNDYSVPDNGFIFLNLLNAFAVICYSIDGTNNVNYAQSYFRPVDGQIYILFPVRKNDTFRTLWTANGGTITVTNAYFIPCQGNI